MAYVKYVHIFLIQYDKILYDWVWG